jgi:MFS family permease
MSATASPTQSPQFRWYLWGSAAWFSAFGIQQVMFGYLVASVLHAPPDQIGLAQASLTIVSTFLLLLGGAVADQIDTRRLMILCHALAIIPAVALSAVVAAGYLRFEWLIVYGLVMGLLTAFIVPSREAMMADVLGPSGLPFIQRAVTTTIGITFIAQIAGMFAARFAASFGAAPIILLQAAIQLFGAFTAYRLHPSTRHEVHAEQNGGSALQRIAAGLSEVKNSPALFPITVITAAIGVLFIGAFMVILPVVLREEYGGEVQQFSSMFIAFWAGSIISSMTISRLGNIANRGRPVVFAVSMGTTILFLLSFKTPLLVFYALVFVWGLGAGVTISMARTIVQEHAPPAHRARVLSIYQLGFTGGMSVGALAIGLVVGAVGARAAALVPAFAMVFVIAWLLTTTKLWDIPALKHDASAPA